MANCILLVLETQEDLVCYVLPGAEQLTTFRKGIVPPPSGGSIQKRVAAPEYMVALYKQRR